VGGYADWLAQRPRAWAQATIRTGVGVIKRDRARAAEIEHQLAQKFERWAALDARAA
jgi:hypothetical protein